MRDRILKSAQEQINKFGFRRFTIDDIASDLGISKKTIYKHFDSKKQIISEVFTKHLEMEKNSTLEALRTEESWLDKLRAVIYCYGQGKFPPQLLKELQIYFPGEWEKTEAIMAFKREKGIDLLLQGIASGAIKRDVHLGVLGLILENTISALFNYKLSGELDLTSNQVLHEIKKIIFYGILTEKSISEECENEI